MVVHLADLDAGLLLGFTTHGFLDRLSLIDEPRKRGVHSDAYKRPVRLTKQAFVTVDDKHDGNRVGPRKMLGAEPLALMPACRVRRKRAVLVPRRCSATRACARTPVSGPSSPMAAPRDSEKTSRQQAEPATGHELHRCLRKVRRTRLVIGNTGGRSTSANAGIGSEPTSRRDQTLDQDVQLVHRRSAPCRSGPHR